LQEFSGKPIRAFVIWEPVLPTDWTSPSTATLRRISDIRAAQFWDKNRLISHSMGEHDRGSIVWDYVAVYLVGVLWENSPPKAVYQGGPVVQVTDQMRSAVAQVVSGGRAKVHQVGQMQSTRY
jgi:hypothetical protein